MPWPVWRRHIRVRGNSLRLCGTRRYRRDNTAITTACYICWVCCIAVANSRFGRQSSILIHIAHRLHVLAAAAHEYLCPKSRKLPFPRMRPWALPSKAQPNAWPGKVGQASCKLCFVRLFAHPSVCHCPDPPTRAKSVLPILQPSSGEFQNLFVWMAGSIFLHFTIQAW